MFLVRFLICLNSLLLAFFVAGPANADFQPLVLAGAEQRFASQYKDPQAVALENFIILEERSSGQDPNMTHEFRWQADLVTLQDLYRVQFVPLGDDGLRFLGLQSSAGTRLTILGYSVARQRGDRWTVSTYFEDKDAITRLGISRANGNGMLIEGSSEALAALETAKAALAEKERLANEERLKQEKLAAEIAARRDAAIAADAERKAAAGADAASELSAFAPGDTIKGTLQWKTSEAPILMTIKSVSGAVIHGSLEYEARGSGKRMHPVNQTVRLDASKGFSHAKMEFGKLEQGLDGRSVSNPFGGSCKLLAQSFDATTGELVLKIDGHRCPPSARFVLLPQG